MTWVWNAVDPRPQLPHILRTTNSFQYDGLGLCRTQKVDSAGTFNYVCDGTTPASAVLADSAAIYTPGLSERRSSTSKFYHGDALSSTRGITNTSQTASDSKLFDAFGMTVSSSGSTPTPFGFVGGAQYQTDADSGLMLLGHRYYDSSVGRFISQDPAKHGGNWYRYCSNNPLARTDPSGLFWKEIIGGTLGIVGGIVGTPIIGIGAGFIGGAIGSYLDGERDPARVIAGGCETGITGGIAGEIGLVGKGLFAYLKAVPSCIEVAKGVQEEIGGGTIIKIYCVSRLLK